MTSKIGIRLSTVALVLVMFGAAVAVGGGIVAGQTTNEVDIDDPGDIVESGSADLIISGVGSTQGVGAFEVNITYNDNIDSIQVSDSDRFTVESETRDSNGETTVTIVGYTGETDASGQDSLTLAEIEVESQNFDTTGEIEVDEVSTLVDPEGDDIVPVNIGAGASFSISEQVDDDDDDTTPGSPSGGSAPVDDEDDVDPDEPEETIQDTREVVEQADPDIDTEREIEDSDPDTPGVTVDTSDETTTIESITFTDEGTTGSVNVREYSDESVTESVSNSLSSQLGQDVRSVGSVADITVTDDDGEPAPDTAATVTMGIDATDVDEPDDVVINHETDDGWEQLETTVQEVTDDRVRVSGDVDGFSLFAVAEVEPEEEPAEEEEPVEDPEDDDGIGTTGLIGLVALIAILAVAAIAYRQMNSSGGDNKL